MEVNNYCGEKVLNEFKLVKNRSIIEPFTERNKCEENANSERLFPDYIKNFKLKFTIYPSPEVSPEESQSDRAPNAFIATI